MVKYYQFRNLLSMQMLKKVTVQVSQITKNPDQAVKIYEYFNDALRAYGLTVKTGEFGTHMNVNINNDGPVAIIYESQDGKIQ